MIPKGKIQMDRIRSELTESLISRLTIVLLFYRGRELFKDKRYSPTRNPVHGNFSSRRWIGRQFGVKLVHDALEDLVLHSAAGASSQPIDVSPLTQRCELRFLLQGVLR